MLNNLKLQIFQLFRSFNFKYQFQIFQLSGFLSKRVSQDINVLFVTDAKRIKIQVKYLIISFCGCVRFINPTPPKRQRF